MIPRLALILVALVAGIPCASAASFVRAVEDLPARPVPTATGTTAGSTASSGSTRTPAPSGGVTATETQPSLADFGFLPDAFDAPPAPTESPSNPDSSGCIDATNSGEDATNGDAGVGVGGCG
jgi:hypothetical protein